MSPHAPRRRWRQLWLLVLCAPLAALAHAHLERTDPADGAVIAAGPAQFTLQFSEVAQLTALTLTKLGGSMPRKLGPLPASAGEQQRVPAPPLDPGTYELRYRLISADSHLSAGSVRFTVSGR